VVTLDPDVRTIAAQFGVDATLIQAVVNAEGNIVKAVQCSIPAIRTREQALQVLCRSAVHAMSDYVKAHCAAGFVDAWAHRWAPTGADNDPTNLNANWSGNVKQLWGIPT
jgi:hypothetical protein